MCNPPEEIILDGGNVNTVIKIGNTVRRKTSPQSDTIHELLLHLEKKEINAPKFLGIDQNNREILSFIEGETNFDESLWQTNDAIIKSVNLLRQYHDATLDFKPTQKPKWAFEYPDSKHHEVICHNDFAPYNMIFHSNKSISIIDFDLCGPGPRMRDLAYLAYWMTPLSFGASDMKEFSEQDLLKKSPRLRLICHTYNINNPKDLPPMVSDVLHHMGNEHAVQKMVGRKVAEHLKLGGHFKHWEQEAKAFDMRLNDLRHALSEQYSKQ